MFYQIKRGNHYSMHLPKIHFGLIKLKVNFMFGAGCWFPIESADDEAINKLVGWSMGLHHKNSVRCGWTPSKNHGMIELFFYLYLRGKRYTHHFASVMTGTKYELEMDLSMNLLSFKLSSPGIPTTMASCSYRAPKFKAGYYLFPYVGGKLPARSDTFIDLEFS